MKVLHTSDWHLGMTLRNGMSYVNDQRHFIDEICKIAEKEKVDAILIAGDVFDRSIASGEALKIYDEAMTKICVSLGIPVCLIAGNHDGAERLASCRGLLKKSGLHIAGALQREPQKVVFDDTEIFLLPWISTDKVRAVYPEYSEEVRSLEDAYRITLNQYRAQMDPDRKHLLVAHAFLMNADTSVSDRAAEVGGATVIGTGVFEGFDYVALGHLHGPQKITDTIRYSGTPMSYSFGKEEKQEKSVVILDTETMEQKVCQIQPLLKRTTLSGTYQELLAADFDSEIVDGYIRLEVTDAYVGMEAIALLKEKYRYLLEITGKSLEQEDARITMTVEEYEQMEHQPEEIFIRYCEDILEEQPGQHLKELFAAALAAYEKEVTES